ncbi:MAG: tryptophan--tRNA ligase [Pseudomonadota bacterium]|nr:tryptophan--tRNA ligase [Pseudomonadota bacterium]
MTPVPRQRILSGIQPTNHITIGNYLGALKNWVALQDRFDCYFAVVDLHAIVTGRQGLTDNTYYALATYLAAGINPERCCLFAQSQVSQHAELAWLLNCYTYMGELQRMTQFKDKSSKAGRNIPAGLFNYPVLMAADILLYQANLVPVGEDQRQHLELTRTLAQRLNKTMAKPLFIVPDAYIPKVGARIMDLRNPKIKMSKSNPSPEGVLYLHDSKDSIAQKIRRATTDSDTEIRYDLEQKAGVSNLLAMQAAISGKAIADLEAGYQGQNYGRLKADCIEVVSAEVLQLQQRITALLADRPYLQSIMNKGAEQARAVAQKTLAAVNSAIGFVSPCADDKKDIS